MNNCWTCKYLELLDVECDLELLKINDSNFTHYATRRCPFASDEMTSYHPSGISVIMLLDIRKFKAWNDGGLDSKYCDGYVQDI